MRKIDYSDLRWNGNEYEIYAGYPLGHVSLNAEIDNLEQYREITSGISLDRLREICDAEREGCCVVLPKIGDKMFYAPYPKDARDINGNPLFLRNTGDGTGIVRRVCTFVYFNNWSGPVSLRKTWKTREEAEAALKGAEHERDL